MNDAIPQDALRVTEMLRRVVARADLQDSPLHRAALQLSLNDATLGWALPWQEPTTPPQE